MRKRPGFTLVELLVVIAIIGVLVALLLPAVQAAREAARRMSCSNKLKQIGLALHNYHDTHQKFPPDAIWGGSTGAIRNDPRHYTWLTMILPFMEQSTLHEQIDFRFPGYNQQVPDTGGTKGLHQVQLPLFECPSEGDTNNNKGWGMTSYAGNMGWDYHRRQFGDMGRAGPFACIDSASFSNCTDGTSNTIFVGEVSMSSFAPPSGITRLNGGGGRVRKGGGRVTRTALVAPAMWGQRTHSWVRRAFGGEPPKRADGSDGGIWGPWGANYCYPPVYSARYAMNNNWPGSGSFHPAGAMYCLMDASVRFIPETIKMTADNTGRNGNLWMAVHTMSGHEPETQVQWP